MSPLRSPAALALVLALACFRHPLAGEDVRERLHVGAADHCLTLLALAAQAVHELRAKDVDLAVQDAPLIRHFLLLLGQLLDQILQVLIPERPEIRESVHFHPSADSRERSASIALNPVGSTRA